MKPQKEQRNPQESSSTNQIGKGATGAKGGKRDGNKSHHLSKYLKYQNSYRNWSITYDIRISNIKHTI